MKRHQRIAKRAFDIVASGAGIILLFPVALVIVIVLKWTTGGPAFYSQMRVGYAGVIFKCIKFCTMKPGSDRHGTVTTSGDMRITGPGKFLRRFKFDELPQLWNVLTGKMSFVGPRPDVPGYADALQGADREMLLLRPGITGPASLIFRYEEQLLAEVARPVEFNDTVIWPAKVRINLSYYHRYSFVNDLGYIVITLLPAANSFLRLLPASPRTLVELESTLKKIRL